MILPYSQWMPPLWDTLCDSYAGPLFGSSSRQAPDQPHRGVSVYFHVLHMIYVEAQSSL